MRRIWIAIALIIITDLPGTCQPTIQWEVSLGGTENDNFDIAGASHNNMKLTRDGGYIFAGITYSNDGDVTGHHDSTNTCDYWVVKLSSSGAIEWQKALGGSLNDYATCVIQADDGGYVVSGTSSSNDGDVSGHHGLTTSSDAWIIKLDSLGNIQWENSYGGSLNDGSNDILQANDGGYIFTGYSQSSDGDLTTNYGWSDFWVVKMNSSGTIEWSRTYGGSLSEGASSLRATPGSGFLLTGYTYSNDSDITYNAHSVLKMELWILRLDNLGNKLWDKCYGGTNHDWVMDAIPTTDGGFALCCRTDSWDGDITFTHYSYDVWLLKLDSLGQKQWSQFFGGTSVDNAATIRQTSDNGFLVSAETSSNDGNVSSNHGMSDCWLIKTDSSGNIEWEKTYGGTRHEYMSVALPTADGGIAFVGSTESNDRDVSSHHGSTFTFDIWMVKLNPYTTGVHNPAGSLTSLSILPNPCINNCEISLVLKARSMISLDIFDITGQPVYSAESKTFESGLNRISLEMTLGGRRLSKGIYFLRARSNSQDMVEKLVLLGD